MLKGVRETGTARLSFLRNALTVGMILVVTVFVAPLGFQSAQAQATPVQVSSGASIERGVNLLVRDGSRTWNAQSIRSVDIVALSLATSMLDADRPEISNRMLPPNMPLEQFDRMINREISRRGMWGYVYEQGARGGAGVANIEPEATRNVLDFVRPQFSFPAGVSADTRRVRLDPTIVAIYDSSIDTLVNNTSGFRYRADTERASGLSPRANGTAYGNVPNTDVADKRLLYAFGAQATFNPSSTNVQLPVTFSTGQTFEQTQMTYCGLIARMYESGRSLEPRDAGLAGAIEGRIDARNNFEPHEVNFAITGPCHP